MGIAGVDFLKGREHGYYEQHRKANRKAVEYLFVSTDREHRPYAVVHGVAIDMHAEPRIVVVRGDAADVHAELVLVTGARVVSWEPKLLEELWKLGVSVTVHAHMTADVAERMQLRETGKPMGWPALYEVASAAS